MFYMRDYCSKKQTDEMEITVEDEEIGADVQCEVLTY